VESRKLSATPVEIAQEVRQEPPLQQQNAQEKETHQAAMKRLTREVHLAFAGNDVGKIQSKLDEIAQLTGPDSPYLLKLLAYWHLTRSENSPDEIAEVEALLTRVLVQMPDDLDAGLNMAIVEIRKQRYAEARQRLETLVMKYSDDDRARRLLRNIPAR